MELPKFNPDGNGPQGVGNLPPEGLRAGLNQADLDLLGASMRPEDNPAMRAEMDRQLNPMLTQSGYVVEREPQTTPPHTAPVAPAVPQAAQTTPDGQAQAAPGEVEARLARIREKYDGDYDELARAYLSANRMSLQTNQENADLRREIGEIKSMLIDRSGGSRAQEPQEPQPQAPLTAEDYYRDPIAATNRLLAEHLGSFAQAQEMARQKERREMEFRETVTARQKDIERLSPIMEEIAGRRPELYRALPREQALDLLIEQARDREAAIRGVNFQSEMYQSLGWQPNPSNPPPAPPQAPPGYQPAPTLGASGFAGAGSASTRAAVPPTGPVQPGAGGNWSNTAAMKRLMGSIPDTSNEDAALNAVLRERQFGEHIPIY